MILFICLIQLDLYTFGCGERGGRLTTQTGNVDLSHSKKNVVGNCKIICVCVVWLDMYMFYS